MKTWLLIFCVVAAGCTCSHSSSVPKPDAPPSSYPASGVVIDQPKDGDTVSGEWVAVTGWLDPSKFSAVLVVGAPNPDFYAPGGGHMALPNATLMVTDAGHFYAPRVPLLADGGTAITVAALPSNGKPVSPQTLTVTGKNVEIVPATLVASPEGGNAPLKVTWTAHAASGSPSFEWDLDGDGVFDAQGTSVTKTYSSAGQVWVMARTQLDSRWVYAVSRIAIAQDPQVMNEVAIGDHARLLTVVPGAEVSKGDDLNAATQAIAVVTDRGIEVFSPSFAPLRVLTPPSPVRGLAGDRSGRLWVALEHSIIRYAADGTLDTTFAGSGSYGGPDGGFGAIGSLCLDGLPRDGSARDTGVELVLVDGTSALSCMLASGCHPASTITAAPPKAIRCAEFGGAVSGYGITDTGGKFFVVNTEERHLRGGDGLTDVQLCTISGPGYIAGVGPGGKLVEWLESASPSRTSALPFEATTVSCDPGATRIRTNNAHYNTDSPPDELPVLLVAGAGKLQRRLMTELDR